LKAIKILGLLGFSLLASSHLLVVEEIKDVIYSPVNHNNASLILDIKQRRYALVIGNSRYSKYLKNPVIDAKGVAAELEKLGFEVILKTNANQEEMEDALNLFHRKLTPKSIALFYYAGHGVQIGGVNYLVPLEANIKKQADVKYKAVDVGLVLDSMGDDREGFNIVILDACRDNPLTRSFSRGAGMHAIGEISHKPDGTLIAYATASGEVAKDGSGRHSPYTKSFLKHLPTPDLSIEEFFKRVSRDVKLVTDKEQKPWISSSYSGSFAFMPIEKGQKITVPLKMIGGIKIDGAIELLDIDNIPGMAAFRTAEKHILTNKKVAFDWYKISAKKGNPMAQAATIYYNLIDKSDVRLVAIKVLPKLKELAIMGVAEAQYFLAYFYREGILPMERKIISHKIDNDKIAMDWYEKSANQGYSVAQYRLSLMYKYGNGVSKDEVLAEKWLKKSKENRENQ